MSQYYHDPSNPLQKVPVQQAPQQQPSTTLNQQAGLAPQTIQQPTYTPYPANFVGPPAPNQIRAPPSTPSTPSTFNPMPPEPGTPYMQNPVSGDVWVNSNYNAQITNIKTPLTPQQTQERNSLIISVNNMPSSNQEALDRGASQYILPAEKERYITSVNAAFPTGGYDTKSFTITPKQNVQTPNLNSPLQQGIFGANFGKAGPQGNFNQMSNVNFNPGNLSPEQRIVGIEATAAIIALPAIGVATAIKAGILNVAISEGMRFIPSNPVTGEYQGKLGSPTQMVGEAAQGVIFAGIGKGLMGGLTRVAKTQMNPLGQVAARAVWTAPGRVATFTALGGAIGGGAEYLQTGQVTPRGVATGAAFGLAFSVGGEIFGRVAQSPRIQNKIAAGKEAVQNKVVNSNLEHLSNIDEHYQKSYMNYESFKPSIGEKLTMKVTGLEPYKPAPATVGLPKISTMSSNSQLKAETLKVSNMADPGTILQGKSEPQHFTPTKLSSGKYNAILSQGLTATKTKQEDTQLLSIEKLTNQPLPRSTDTQLTNIEQLTKQQLPRQTNAQTERAIIDAKINERNFDAQTTSTKIDTQLKQATNFFDQKTANTNMNRALQEARAEKAQVSNNLYPELKQGSKGFITGLENTKGYPSKPVANYLIKQPATSNLNLSDQINIRGSNTFDSIKVNERINSMLNEVPTKGNYDNYNRIMSQGKTTTTTRVRQTENQLSNIEQLTNTPLPRLSSNQSRNILPNSFTPETTLTKPTMPQSKQATSNRLIPSINFDSVQQSVTQRMNTQFSGTDLFTSRSLTNRLKNTNLQDVKTKIGQQISGTKITAGIAQTNIGKQVTNTKPIVEQQSSRLKHIIGIRQTNINIQSSRVKTNLTIEKSVVILGQGQQQSGQRTTTTISTPTTGIGQWLKTTPTTIPTTSQTTIPITAPTITTTHSQGSFLNSNVKTSLMFGVPGSQFEGRGFPSFGSGKKTGIKSYKREYPILTGEELLGF
jgi:hypothetical protein